MENVNHKAAYATALAPDVLHLAGPEQGFLLGQEGVELKDRTHVSLKKYQWDE